MTFNQIPSISPSNSPSDLTTQEISSLKPNQRSTYQYERSLADYRGQIDYLKEALNKAQADCDAWLAHDREREVSVQEVLPLRWEKRSHKRQFILATGLSVIGGALISSFPVANSPVGFWVGWTLIGCSIFFSPITTL